MKYHEGERLTLYHGDNREVMRSFEEASIDAIVCDPPYELGFMGKKWDASGIAYSVEMWREALRVLKPGGHLLAFSGSRTYHRMTVAIEDAGFDIRDQIMWIYGSGFPKSHNLKDEWAGWGTALKPAHEPIVVARKPLIGTVAENVLTYGTGGLNIDGTRVTIAPGDEPSAGHRTATFGNQDTISGGDGSGGWTASSGRWPANVIHDGSDEIVELFPHTAAGARPARANEPTGAHYEGGWGPISEGPRIQFDSGSAARFFYCAKASKKDRNEGLDGFELKRRAGLVGADRDGELDEVSERWRTQPSANHHPTVKPTDLMRYLCRLVTPPNGVILDPFMGSGSTGKAAILEGFRFIGIEMTDEYLPIAKARIEWATKQGDHDLFGGAL